MSDAPTSPAEPQPEPSSPADAGAGAPSAAQDQARGAGAGQPTPSASPQAAGSQGQSAAPGEQAEDREEKEKKKKGEKARRAGAIIAGLGLAAGAAAAGAALAGGGRRRPGAPETAAGGPDDSATGSGRGGLGGAGTAAAPEGELPSAAGAATTGAGEPGAPVPASDAFAVADTDDFATMEPAEAQPEDLWAASEEEKPLFEGEQPPPEEGEEGEQGEAGPPPDDFGLGGPPEDLGQPGIDLGDAASAAAPLEEASGGLSGLEIAGIALGGAAVLGGGTAAIVLATRDDDKKKKKKGTEQPPAETPAEPPSDATPSEPAPQPEQPGKPGATPEPVQPGKPSPAPAGGAGGAGGAGAEQPGGAGGPGAEQAGGAGGPGAEQAGGAAGPGAEQAGGPGGAGAGQEPGQVGGPAPAGAGGPGAAPAQLVGMDREQARATAEAISQATGLPPSQVVALMKDSIRDGKLDPQQLVGNLQNAVRPRELNGAALIEALTNKANALGGLKGVPLLKLAAGIAEVLAIGAKAVQAAPAVIRSVRDLAKAVQNALKKLKQLIRNKLGKQHKAVCRVHKDGQVLRISEQQIISCVVHLDTELPGTFQLTLTDNDFKLSESDTFKEGTKIGIELGWQDGKSAVLMVGEVVSRELQFPKKGPILLVVTGFTLDHRLNRGRFSRMWQKKADAFETTDSWVAEQVIQSAGLEKGTIDDTEVKFEYVFQNNMTNLEFLRQRAAYYGFEVTVDTQGKVHFRRPPLAKKPAVTLKRGNELKHFHARMELTTQVPKVVVRGHNPAQPETAHEGKAETAQLWDKMNLKTLGPEAIKKYVTDKMGGPGIDEKQHGAVELLVRTPLISEQHALALAKGLFNRRAYRFVRGEGSTTGNPDLLAGITIELQDVGKRFDGRYYVTSARHIYERNGYTTLFYVARPGVSEIKPPVPPPPVVGPPVVLPPLPTKKTFFEFMSEGLKQLPTKEHPLQIQRTTDPGKQDKPAEDKLDAQGTIRKPGVDPGYYNLTLKEIVGGTWGVEPAGGGAGQSGAGAGQSGGGAG